MKPGNCRAYRYYNPEITNVSKDENMSAWRAILVAGAIICVSLSSVAAELQVIAGGGIAAPLKEIAAQFEKTTGHKLVIRYGTTPELIKMATGGPFDLGIVPVDVLKNDAARATFAAGASPEVARVGIGVAVRAGAPKPDIGTPDALKRTLLNAKSIASIPESADGYLLARIYERLGITEAMKAKISRSRDPRRSRNGGERRNRARRVPYERPDCAGIDLVGPFPPKSSWKWCTQRRYLRYEGSRSGEGLHRLFQEPRSRCGHQVREICGAIMADPKPNSSTCLSPGGRTSRPSQNLVSGCRSTGRLAQQRSVDPIMGIVAVVIHATGCVSEGAISVMKKPVEAASFHWLVPDEDEPQHGQFVWACVPKPLPPGMFVTPSRMLTSMAEPGSKSLVARH